MTYRTIVPAGDLATLIAHQEVAVIDCRFALDDPGRGHREYLESHIPGAVYAHLDDDLAGPVTPGRTGRHPLPNIDDFSSRLSRWGIDENVQVVVYDDQSGAYAARLWWLLRWLGHDAVAVLDGGWRQWRQENYPTRAGQESRTSRRFAPRPRSELIADSGEILKRLGNEKLHLVDARAPERYRGESEPIDPIAGHVPGAANFPHTQNIGPDGRYLPRETLSRQFRGLLNNAPPNDIVFYCGSGVTAAQNALCFAHAGLGDARLYPGSWSDWITDPRRPIERG